jgi:hypothetical protein
MIEPTVTQNGALFLAQHKIAKQPAGLLRRFRSAIGKRRPKLEAELRSGLFAWPRLPRPRAR